MRSSPPLVTLLTILSFLALAARGALAAAPPAAWTVMVYADCDNELEKPILDNLNEMLGVGSTDQVQVVALCDRSPKKEPKDEYSDENLGDMSFWTGTRILHIEKNHVKLIADWGSVDVGDKSTLARFVEAAAQSYPAQHYALIISDHGGGWSQMCVDESHGNSALTLRDLRSALEPFAKAHGKLDFIGLDMCLMASYETAQALAPVAHLMMASEDVETSRGWVYGPVLKALQEQPAMSAELLSKAFVGSYIGYLNGLPGHAKYEAANSTLSAVNLDLFPDLQKAMDALADHFSTLLNGRHTLAWQILGAARTAAYPLGLAGPEQVVEMYDLEYLNRKMIELEGPAPATQEVDRVLKQMICAATESTLRPQVAGLSIFFPQGGFDVHSEECRSYGTDTFIRESHWMGFLFRYAAEARVQNQEPELVDGAASSAAASSGMPCQLTAYAPGYDIASSSLVVMAHEGADLVEIGKMPVHRTGPGADPNLHYSFAGSWFAFNNGIASLECPTIAIRGVNGKDDNPDKFVYVDAQVKRAGTDAWIDASFTFLTRADSPSSFTSGPLLTVYADTKEGPLEIHLKQGDAVRPKYRKHKVNGETEVFPGGEHGIPVEKPENFHISWGPLTPDLYSVGFEVLNYAGEGNLVLTDVRVR